MSPYRSTGKCDIGFSPASVQHYIDLNFNWLTHLFLIRRSGKLRTTIRGCSHHIWSLYSQRIMCAAPQFWTNCNLIENNRSTWHTRLAHPLILRTWLKKRRKNWFKRFWSWCLKVGEERNSTYSPSTSGPNQSYCPRKLLSLQTALLITTFRRAERLFWKRNISKIITHPPLPNQISCCQQQKGLLIVRIIKKILKRENLESCSGGYPNLSTSTLHGLQPYPYRDVPVQQQQPSRFFQSGQ